MSTLRPKADVPRPHADQEIISFYLPRPHQNCSRSPLAPRRSVSHPPQIIESPAASSPLLSPTVRALSAHSPKQSMTSTFLSPIAQDCYFTNFQSQKHQTKTSPSTVQSPITRGPRSSRPHRCQESFKSWTPLSPESMNSYVSFPHASRPSSPRSYNSVPESPDLQEPNQTTRKMMEDLDLSPRESYRLHILLLLVQLLSTTVHIATITFFTTVIASETHLDVLESAYTAILTLFMMTISILLMTLISLLRRALTLSLYVSLQSINSALFVLTVIVLGIISTLSEDRREITEDISDVSGVLDAMVIFTAITGVPFLLGTWFAWHDHYRAKIWEDLLADIQHDIQVGCGCACEAVEETPLLSNAAFAIKR